MLKILGRKTSSNVQKVLWCCDELNIPYEREDIGGPFGGNREPEYLALNPNGTVPTVVDGDLVLWESNCIVRYLAARHGDGSLHPTDPGARALADRWMDWQLSVIGPPMVVVFLGLVRHPPEKRDTAAIAAARDKLAAALKILDSHLATTAYVAGASFTMGDIPLGIAAYRWFTLDIEREDYPHLQRWYETLAARPPFAEHVAIGIA